MARFVILTAWDGREIAVNPDHVAMVEPRTIPSKDEPQSLLRLAIPTANGEDPNPVSEAIKGTVADVVAKLTWRTDGGI